MSSSSQRGSSGNTAIGLLVLLLISYGGASRIARLSVNDGVEERMAAEVIHQTNSWCMAMPDASQSQLQAALDWACGDGTNLGNADCSAIQSSGACYKPDTVAAHASYAFNQYYQAQNRQQGSCFFGGVAEITYQDPSTASCTYPSSGSTFGTNSTTNNPGFGTGTGITTNVASGMELQCILHLLCLLLAMTIMSEF